jgi:hypothetical protein
MGNSFTRWKVLQALLHAVANEFIRHAGTMGRWAVLLRQEPSRKEYRGAVSSNRPYVFKNILAEI